MGKTDRLTRFWGTIAMISSFVLAVGNAHQLIKIIARKSADDVSLWMWISLVVAATTWLIYGVRKKDIFLIITNILYLIVGALLVFFTIYY